MFGGQVDALSGCVYSVWTYFLRWLHQQSLWHRHVACPSTAASRMSGMSRRYYRYTEDLQAAGTPHPCR